MLILRGGIYPSNCEDPNKCNSPAQLRKRPCETRHMDKVSFIYGVLYHTNLDKCATPYIKIYLQFTVKKVLNTLATIQNMKVYFKKDYIF